MHTADSQGHDHPALRTVCATGAVLRRSVGRYDLLYGGRALHLRTLAAYATPALHPSHVGEGRSGDGGEGQSDKGTVDYLMLESWPEHHDINVRGTRHLLGGYVIASSLQGDPKTKPYAKSKHK